MKTMRHATTKMDSRFFRCTSFRHLILFVLSILLASATAGDTSAKEIELNRNKGKQYVQRFDFESLRLAIEDLTETNGSKYPKGAGYLKRLDRLKRQSSNLGGMMC